MGCDEVCDAGESDQEDERVAGGDEAYVGPGTSSGARVSFCDTRRSEN